MPGEGINCFTKLGLHELDKKVKDLVDKGMSEREAAFRVAEEYNKEINKDLNSLKQKVGVKQEAHTPIDIDKIKKVDEAYDKKISDNKQKEFEEKLEEPKESNAGSGEPPIEPPTEETSGIYEENPQTILSHRGLQEISSEFGLEDVVSRTKKTDLELNKEAQTTIDKWVEEGSYSKNIENLIKIAEEKSGVLTDNQRVILQTHLGKVRNEARGIRETKGVNSPEYDAKSKELERLRLAGQSARSEAGAALRIPTDRGNEPLTVDDALIIEKESLGVEELSAKEKEKVVKEFEELQKVKDDLAKSQEENLRLQSELKAQSEIAKNKKTVPKEKTNKTHEDYVKDRQAIIEAAKEKIKAAREKAKDPNAPKKQGIGGRTYADDLITIAPEVFKLMKSLGEEGIHKLEEVVKNIHKEFKGIVPELTERDVVDILAGDYNKKKPLLTTLTARLRDLKTEAKLIKKLEDERLGKEPVDSKKKNEKSRRIIDLQNKIKEIRDRNKDTDPIEKTDAERLAAKRKSILKRIDEIEADVKEGKFEKKEELPPVRLDKKTQALQDRLIELEKQQATRRAKQDYDKLGKWDKLADTFWQITGLRRLINSAIDFSIMFRQASPITMNILKYVPRVEDGKLKMNTAPKAIGQMFNLAFSPKAFDRFQYNLEKSEVGRMFTHFNGVFSKPTEVKMEKREEEFTNSLLHRIGQKIEASDNQTLKKAAEIADKIWFSERAAAGLINTIRVEEFNKQVKNLERKGITPENSPEHYKEAVKWAMNITGRGNLLGMLEDSHAGRLAANRTYFGARLMAAKINMLNPYYYLMMPKEIRAKAIGDVAGNVTTMFLAAMAFQAAGANVSLNPDEPDFLQVRFGDKVYDITGGSVAYVRTFLRIMRATAQQIKNPGSKAANSYTGFMGRSVWKSLVANKLSPNTAYAYHFFTGKSGEYDEKGKPKPFDPYEVAEVYPLYVDGTMEAYKKGGLGEALTILLPDMFGIGTQQYDKKGEGQTKMGGAKYGGGNASGEFPKSPKLPPPPRVPH